MLRPQFEAMPALSILSCVLRRPLRPLSALVAVLLLACSQGDGETCQDTRDCEDGLICLPAGRSERSVCGTRDEADAGGGGGDEGEPELPPDDAGADDAGPDDAGDQPSEQDAGDEPADLDAG